MEYYPVDQLLRRANGDAAAVPEPPCPAGRRPLVLEFPFTDEAANWYDPDLVEDEGAVYENEYEDFPAERFVNLVSWSTSGHDWLEAQTARRELVMLIGFGEDCTYVSARVGYDGPWHTLSGQDGYDPVHFNVNRYTVTFARIEVPRRLTASEGQAKQAVEHFCKRRELDPALNWLPGRHPDLARVFKEACEGE